MSIVYYGTNIADGVIISSQGVILSEIEKRLLILQKISPNIPSEKLENLALHLYGISHRRYTNPETIYNVLVSTTLAGARAQSMDSVDDNFLDNHLILSLNVPQRLFEKFQMDGSIDSYLASRRLPIDGLFELHFNQSPENIELMVAAFDNREIKPRHSSLM